MASSDAMMLFDFEDANEAAWTVVNDGVMGGNSEGYVRRTADGTLRFTGTLVTEGGGFTSARTEEAVDLSGYDGLALRVRGGGRSFQVDVRDGTQVRGMPLSRRASFPTSADWQTVRVPFSALGKSVRGRAVPGAPPLEPSAVQGLALFMADGQNGAFRLEVDAIRAYRAEE
jgi:hypothetical protein